MLALEDYPEYHHHHHWHNSPFWAKAFLRSFCQLSLFLAAFFQFLSPSFLASSVTPSSHLSFGLPLCLLPSTTATSTRLVGLCSSIRITCPAHFNRLILMYVTISFSLYIAYNSCVKQVPRICLLSNCIVRAVVTHKSIKFIHPNMTGYIWFPYCLMEIFFENIVVLSFRMHEVTFFSYNPTATKTLLIPTWKKSYNRNVWRIWLEISMRKLDVLKESTSGAGSVVTSYACSRDRWYWKKKNAE